jgi:hypothetical protein
VASSLTGQAQAALMRLYEQAKHTTDNFALERIDRALDEIIRLNSTDPPDRQVRSALANAYKVIRDRRQTVSSESLEARQADVASLGGDEDVIDLREWLRGTPHVTGRQRDVLTLLADDHDATDIAVFYNIPTSRAREQISRARRAARAAHDNDMNAA